MRVKLDMSDMSKPYRVGERKFKTINEAVNALLNAEFEKTEKCKSCGKHVSRKETWYGLCDVCNEIERKS